MGFPPVYSLPPNMRRPCLSGKVFIVTGANAGLGFGASKELARRGAKVIMAYRNMDKAQTVPSQIILVGYNSPSQFSREYKRHFGYAPSATS